MTHVITIDGEALLNAIDSAIVAAERAYAAEKADKTRRQRGTAGPFLFDLEQRTAAVKYREGELQGLRLAREILVG